MSKLRNMLIVMGIVGIVAAIIIIPRMRFTPHWDAYQTQTCHIGTACELDDQAKSAWSDENINRYRYPTGVGFKLTFHKVLASGKDGGQKTFVLRRWEKPEDSPSNLIREDEVTQAQQQFEKMEAWWKSPEPDHRKVLLLTDITGVINPNEAAYVAQNWTDLHLDQSVNAGDGLTLSACQITQDTNEHCAGMNIPAGNPDRSGEIQPMLNKLSRLNPTELGHTALYEQLANLFSEKSKGNQMPEEVHIYTDGMEYYGNVDFYHKDRLMLMDERTWPELEQVIESSTGQWVSLNGVTFTIYPPHRSMNPAEKQEVDQALKFFSRFITDHGGTVNIVNEGLS